MTTKHLSSGMSQNSRILIDVLKECAVQICAMENCREHQHDLRQCLGNTSTTATARSTWCFSQHHACLIDNVGACFNLDDVFGFARFFV